MMNRGVLDRQMFRRGGAVRMQEGGNAFLEGIVQRFVERTGRPPTDAELREILIMTRDITGPMAPADPNMVPQGQDFYPMPPEALGPMGGQEMPAPAQKAAPQLPPKMDLEQFFQNQPVRRAEGGPAMRMPSDMAEMAGTMPAAVAAMSGPPTAVAPVSPEEAAGAQVMDPAMVEQLMASAAEDVGDPETAEDYEQMMNMIRGDKATVQERRSELGMLVGEEDAMQTPESVLALVQPVVQIAALDQGVGALAAEQMTAPVEGDMAGGIMTMAGSPEEEPPVNFNMGGVVRPVQRFQQGGGVPQQTIDLLSAGLEAAQPFLGAPANPDAAAVLQQAINARPVPAAPVAEPRSRLREIVEGQRDLYREYGLGDPAERAAALEDQRKMAQAQMLFDIAQTALTFAAPMQGEPMGLSPAERLAMAASSTQLPQTIGARVQGILEAEQAARKEGRAIDLAALQSAETKYAAETEAAAKADIARQKIAADRSNLAAEIASKSETGTFVDPNTGITLGTVTTQVLNPDNTVSRQTKLNVIGEDTEGNPTYQILDIPTDVETQEIQQSDGSTILYSRRKGVPDAQWAPVTGPDGSPMVTKLAPREVRALGDDLVVFNPYDPKAQTLLKSKQKDIVTVQGTIALVDKDAGTAVPIYTAPGSGTKPEYRVIRDTRTDTESYVDINTPAGKAAVDKATAANDAAGRTVVTVRTVPSQTQPKAVAFALPDRPETVLSYDGGRTYVDQSGEIKAVPGGAVPLSDTIAYDIMGKLRTQDRAARELEALQDEFGPDFVINYRGGTRKEPEALSAQDRTALRDAMNAARGGTGPYSGFAVFLDRTFAGAIPAAREAFQDTQSSRQFLRGLTVLGRSALVINPRFPVAEMENVSALFPDPDAFFANPETEANKLVELKRLAIQQKAANLAALSGGGLDDALAAQAKANNFEIDRLLDLLSTVPLEVKGAAPDEGKIESLREVLRRGRGG